MPTARELQPSPCACWFACKLDPCSADWHRAHEVVHLLVFPKADAATRNNLRMLVRVHEDRQARALERLS